MHSTILLFIIFIITYHQSLMSAEILNCKTIQSLAKSMESLSQIQDLNNSKSNTLWIINSIFQFIKKAAETDTKSHSKAESTVIPQIIMKEEQQPFFEPPGLEKSDNMIQEIQSQPSTANKSTSISMLAKKGYYYSYYLHDRKLVLRITNRYGDYHELHGNIDAVKRPNEALLQLVDISLKSNDKLNSGKAPKKADLKSQPSFQKRFGTPLPSHLKEQYYKTDSGKMKHQFCHVNGGRWYDMSEYWTPAPCMFSLVQNLRGKSLTVPKSKDSSKQTDSKACPNITDHIPPNQLRPLVSIDMDIVKPMPDITKGDSPTIPISTGIDEQEADSKVCPDITDHIPPNQPCASVPIDIDNVKPTQDPYQLYVDYDHSDPIMGEPDYQCDVTEGQCLFMKVDPLHKQYYDRCLKRRTIALKQEAMDSDFDIMDYVKFRITYPKVVIPQMNKILLQARAYGGNSFECNDVYGHVFEVTYISHSKNFKLEWLRHDKSIDMREAPVTPSGVGIPWHSIV